MHAESYTGAEMKITRGQDEVWFGRKLQQRTLQASTPGLPFLVPLALLRHSHSLKNWQKNVRVPSMYERKGRWNWLWRNQLWQRLTRRRLFGLWAELSLFHNSSTPVPVNTQTTQNAASTRHWSFILPGGFAHMLTDASCPRTWPPREVSAKPFPRGPVDD